MPHHFQLPSLGTNKRPNSFIASSPYHFLSLFSIAYSSSRISLAISLCSFLSPLLVVTSRLRFPLPIFVTTSCPYLSSSHLGSIPIRRFLSPLLVSMFPHHLFITFYWYCFGSPLPVALPPCPPSIVISNCSLLSPFLVALLVAISRIHIALHFHRHSQSSLRASILGLHFASSFTGSICISFFHPIFPTPSLVPAFCGNVFVAAFLSHCLFCSSFGPISVFCLLDIFAFHFLQGFSFSSF